MTLYHNGVNNPEDDLNPDSFGSLKKFKKKTEEFGNKNELEKIERRLFIILYTGMHGIEGKMQDINHAINQKISRSDELKHNCPQIQQQLTNELDWSTPPLDRNSPIERPSLRILHLNIDYRNNEDKYSNNPREDYIWKKDMIISETQDNIRKIRFWVDRFNIRFVGIQNHLNLIQSNGFKLEAEIAEILSYYNSEIKPSGKFTLAIRELCTTFKKVKITLDAFTNRLLELETKTNDLQQLTSRTSVRETLEILFPGNPFLTLEYKKARDCLDQLQKMNELADELHSCLLDLIRMSDFTKNVISQTHSQIHSLPD